MSFEEKLSLPNANYNRIYKSIVELIPNDWIQLFKTKTSQQSLLKVFNLTTEAQKKLKIFKNFQIKKSTSLFNLITRIIINLLNLFHGQIILKGILFSVLKIFSNWFKKCSDCYIFLIWYKLVHFSLPRSSAIHRMGNTPTTLCPRCKEREESHPHFIFHCKLSQTTLSQLHLSHLISINLNYNFQFPFKICVKDILMGTSCHTHDGVKLEILPTLTEVFLRHLSFCRRKEFYEDG